jgi:uncharacterized protein YdiU (UPF0061 family)
LIADEPTEAVRLAMEVIDAFPARYAEHLLAGQRAKLGLAAAGDASDDAALAADWLALLHSQHVDFTLAWRRLADVAAGDESALRALFADAAALDEWLSRWRERVARDGGSASDRAARMRRTSPWIIPRNHRVEAALAAASSSDRDLAPFEQLLDAVRRPYEEAPDLALYAEPAPADVTACYRTFCGT